MPVSEEVAARRQERHDARMAAAREVVPHGAYCYAATGPMASRAGPDGTHSVSMPVATCPHWSTNGRKRDRQDGYCRLMRVGDWMGRGASLLWDQVKECGVNRGGAEDGQPPA